MFPPSTFQPARFIPRRSMNANPLYADAAWKIHSRLYLELRVLNESRLLPDFRDQAKIQQQ
jgi:hypothetical protein